jgi:glycosyltransferase EpsD
MKKVLLVANVAKEHVNKFHIPTIKYLQSKGWKVDIACSVDAEIKAGDNIYNMSWKRSPFTPKTFKGIKELKKLIAQNHYDIIYCHTPVGGLVARIAARSFRKQGLKVVYCAHGLHFFKGAPLLNWLLFYPMEKWMAKFTDMFITINPEDYELVKQKFNHEMKVEMIHGIGVNFDRLDISDKNKVREKYREDLHIPKEATVLIYVAEILKNKNQQMLIHVLKQLREKGKDVYLLLPGPNHQHGEYQKIADNLGLHDYVKFLGWCSDIGQLMVASDICVASSIREGFGINLVEAQYCHLPVVAVSNRGHRAIIKDGVNGFLVPLNDCDAMTNKILSLMDDKALYMKLSNVNVDEYKAEYVANQIYCFLKSL